MLCFITLAKGFVLGEARKCESLGLPNLKGHIILTVLRTLSMDLKIMLAVLVIYDYVTKKFHVQQCLRTMQNALCFSRFVFFKIARVCI